MNTATQLTKVYASDSNNWLNIASSGGLPTDADVDTRLQVEESADEDFIRFDTAGSERMLINNLGRVGINTPNPLDIFEVTGEMLINHTATKNNNHALEIDFNAFGFGDSKALDIVYITGAIAQGIEEGVILINIDESASTGGSVIGLEVLGTEGSSALYGLEAGVGVNPMIQLAGEFIFPTGGEINGADNLSNFISNSADVGIFENDTNTVIVGLDEKFEEIEFLLNTVASGGGIDPLFEFSTGVGSWQSFVPTDGTNGMKNSGVVAWLSTDTPGWTTSNGDYLIRITRTKNNLTTTPVEDVIKVAAVVEYLWDKNGKLTIASFNNKGTYEDSNNESGNSGQVLSSTGVGTDWVDASSLISNISTSTIVNAGTAVTLGELSVRIPTTGNRSIQLNPSAAMTLSGTGKNSISSPVSFSTSANQSVSFPANTWTYWNSGTSLAAYDSTQELLFYDEISFKRYRVSVIIGSGFNNNMIAVERL